MTTDEIEQHFGSTEKVAEFLASLVRPFTSGVTARTLNPKGRAAEAAYRTAGELEFNPERYGKNTSPSDQ
jgi:hypothetical protein